MICLVFSAIKKKWNQSSYCVRDKRGPKDTIIQNDRKKFSRICKHLAFTQILLLKKKPVLSNTCLFFCFNRDVAQNDIPTLLDVRTYGDRLLIVFNKGEMRRFIVVVYNSEVYIRTYC